MKHFIIIGLLMISNVVFADEHGERHHEGGYGYNNHRDNDDYYRREYNNRNWNTYQWNYTAPGYNVPYPRPRYYVPQYPTYQQYYEPQYQIYPQPIIGIQIPPFNFFFGH